MFDDTCLQIFSDGLMVLVYIYESTQSRIRSSLKIRHRR